MPTLYMKNNKLLLNVSDAQESERNPDVGVFLRTILDYTFDSKKNQYYYNDIQNIILISKIILETTKFFMRLNLQCDLDDYCKQIMKDSEKSQSNFSEAKSKGIAIRAIQMPHLEESLNFKRILKPYQIKSVKHLFEIGHGANFSVPGSGKTTITFATFSLWKEYNTINKIMVIGPRSSFMPWEEEFEQCFGKKS